MANSTMDLSRWDKSGVCSVLIDLPFSTFPKWLSELSFQYFTRA
jgi:hypothetical protein